MNSSLLLSLLSMDIYNRCSQVFGTFGGAGVFRMDGETLGDLEYLGNHATLQIGLPFDNDYSFHAELWRHNGQLIIVYEGTDNPGGNFDLEGILEGGLLNGWTVGGGFSGATQAKYAIAFFEKARSALQSRRASPPSPTARPRCCVACANN